MCARRNQTNNPFYEPASQDWAVECLEDLWLKKTGQAISPRNCVFLCGTLINVTRQQFADTLNLEPNTVAQYLKHFYQDAEVVFGKAFPAEVTHKAIQFTRWCEEAGMWRRSSIQISLQRLSKFERFREPVMNLVTRIWRILDAKILSDRSQETRTLKLPYSNSFQGNSDIHTAQAESRQGNYEQAISRYTHCLNTYVGQDLSYLRLLIPLALDLQNIKDYAASFEVVRLAERYNLFKSEYGLSLIYFLEGQYADISALDTGIGEQARIAFACYSKAFELSLSDRPDCLSVYNKLELAMKFLLKYPDTEPFMLGSVDEYYQELENVAQDPDSNFLERREAMKNSVISLVQHLEEISINVVSNSPLSQLDIYLSKLKTLFSCM